MRNQQRPLSSFFRFRPGARRARGFTLVELSIVLVVVALVIGAVSVGRDLMRNANYQRLGSSFVRGWQLAYASYQQNAGVVILDSQTEPTGFVNANTTGEEGKAVCGDALRSAMLAQGVEMPQGRGEGLETQYSYLDSNGNPQEARVCFRSMSWMLETEVPGTYRNELRNVMVIEQVTPDLARLIDSLVDSARDAQYGKVREFPTAPGITALGESYPGPTKKEYSLTNRCLQGTQPGCVEAYDEGQIATLTLYYLMD